MCLFLSGWHHVDPPQSENNSAAGIKHFAWIPEYMLSAMTTSTEVKEDVETAMAETILPLPPKGEDEIAWTERLLLVMRGIESDEAVRNLLALANLKPNSTLPLERFIDCCVAYNGGTVDENETAVKKNLVMCTQRVVGMWSIDICPVKSLNNCTRLVLHGSRASDRRPSSIRQSQ